MRAGVRTAEFRVSWTGDHELSVGDTELSIGVAGRWDLRGWDVDDGTYGCVGWTNDERQLVCISPPRAACPGVKEFLGDAVPVRRRTFSRPVLPVSVPVSLCARARVSLSVAQPLCGSGLPRALQEMADRP
jgi:hypothetical protein